MAMAGLLNDQSATVHFEALVAFREAFPDIEATDHIYTIAPSRFTCAGGAAIFDLLFALLTLDHGERLARQVAQDLVHGQIRAASDDQRLTLDHQWHDRQPRLAHALRVMEDHLEEPLALASLTRRVGQSRGTLERLFREHLCTTPMRHYLDMRLVKARHLLTNSAFPLGEVGLACGFSSPAAFSRAFRRRYGQAPSQCRRLSRAP